MRVKNVLFFVMSSMTSNVSIIFSLALKLWELLKTQVESHISNITHFAHASLLLARGYKLNSLKIIFELEDWQIL